MSGPKKDQMHPEDMRNLFIFLVLATLVYFTYDALILKPHAAAQRAARMAQIAEQQAQTYLAKEELPLPRGEALAKTERLSIDNGKVFGTIALTGGRMDDIALHDYFTTLEKTENISVLSPKGTDFPRYNEYGWVSDDKNLVLPGPDSHWQVRGNTKLTTENPVILTWDNGRGLRFEREIAVDDLYMFTVTQRVINNTGRPVTLYPYGLFSQAGIPADFQPVWFMHEGPKGWIGDKLVEITYKKLHEEPHVRVEGTKGWVGIADKYWLVSFIPRQGENIKYSFNYTGVPKPEKNQGRYQVDFTGQALTVAPGQSGESQSHIFAGPKRVIMLDDYSKQLGVPHFDLAVDFGWLWFLSRPFFFALHFLGEQVGNLGIAIIILTIAIRSAVFPLTNVSYRSFAKMKKVSPQISALRAQYGDDKPKLQQELVKMYEREGVNPMAGCIPILIQIPIFFALYKTFYITIETRHAPFFGWIHDLSAPDPTNIFNLFGLINWDPPSFLHVGIFPCLMLVAMLIQKNLNPPPQDPLQRDMQRYFPFVITYVLSKFPSGLVLYWTFSATIGIIQQIIIMRSLDVPIHLFGQTDEEKELEKAVDKGPALHPLADMAEEQAEEALFGHDGPEKPISPPKRKKKKKK
jgi:YidC/Oxa1 family membrane protein insertase